MPTITDLFIELPKTDVDMTYLYKKNINETNRQNLRKKDVYESDIYKIYNLMLGQTNEQLQEKFSSEATFQSVKTDRDPIGYLMILKRLWFSNQSEQHPIRSLCLATRRMYNTVWYANENTTDYLVRFLNSQKVNEVFNVSLIKRGVQ